MKQTLRFHKKVALNFPVVDYFCINRLMMKLATKLFFILGSVALGGFIVIAARAYQNMRMTNAVAEEGYETADDILFPNSSRKSGRMHYGPVLPNDESYLQN
jgi:hypothetical protein